MVLNWMTLIEAAMSSIKHLIKTHKRIDIEVGELEIQYPKMKIRENDEKRMLKTNKQ